MMLRRLCMALAGLAFSAGCLATGYTTEQEALANLSRGRHPVALSGDGKWIFHVDAQRMLRRTGADGLKSMAAIKLGMPVFALSASRSGKNVVLLGPRNCLAIATFDAGLAPSVAWFTSPHAHALEGECSTLQNEPADALVSDSRYAIAISSDAKLIATPSPYGGVKLIDAEHPASAWQIPTGQTGVTQLKFLDSDRKLLIVMARMGEGYESPSTGSNMQFAIWDLQKRELFNLHASADAENLLEPDFVSTYATGSGEALMFTSAGQSAAVNASGEPTGRLVPASSYRVDLKRCGASRLALLDIPQEGLVDVAADPHGRWFASVAAQENAKTHAAQSLLLVRDRAGKVLLRRNLGYVLTGLISSNDGATLYGSTRDPRELDEAQRPRTVKGEPGGELKAIDLTAAIAGMARVDGTWSDARCQLEDEDAAARDIAIDGKALPALASITLKFTAGDENAAQTCGPYPGMTPAQPWRFKEDGTVLIDSGSALEQRNPADGKLLRQFATPRSKTVCSVVDWKDNRFLSWQGDTISTSPLEAGSDKGQRKLLVRMPGWRVRGVESLGGRFGVRWVSNQCKEDSTAGGALAITYDRMGKELARVKGEACQISYDQEEYSDEPLFKPAKPAAAKYRWESSHAGSVRARKRAAAGQPERTVLWSGLAITPAPIFAQGEEESPTGTVSALGGSFGVHVHGRVVDIFDVAARRRVASIKLAAPGAIAWHEASRTLVIEDASAGGAATVLRAYRLD